MLVSSCFETHFASKGFHGSQTFLHPLLQHFYPNFLLIYHQLSWKNLPLVRSEILGLFGNTFTADRMYSPHRWEKLPQHVETQLSQKQRTFSIVFVAYLECTQNFLHFSKTDLLHSLNMSKVLATDK